MACGIYKITSPSGKCYIGQSKDIAARWDKECRCAFDSKDKTYNYPLSRAIRKHGKSLKFEIIEECSPEDLSKREKFWIEFYNSYREGYNQTPGGEAGPEISGENNPNAKLKLSDVIAIRIRWAQCRENLFEIYKDYANKISYSTLQQICSWKTWKDILPHLNTRENQLWHNLSIKSAAIKRKQFNQSYFSEEDVIHIRALYSLGSKPKDILLLYPDASLNSIYKIVYNRSFKDIDTKLIEQEILRLKGELK